MYQLVVAAKQQATTKTLQVFIAYASVDGDSSAYFLRDTYGSLLVVAEE